MSGRRSRPPWRRFENRTGGRRAGCARMSSPPAGTLPGPRRCCGRKRRANLATCGWVGAVVVLGRGRGTLAYAAAISQATRRWRIDRATAGQCGLGDDPQPGRERRLALLEDCHRRPGTPNASACSPMAELMPLSAMMPVGCGCCPNQHPETVKMSSRKALYALALRGEDVRPNPVA